MRRQEQRDAQTGATLGQFARSITIGADEITGTISKVSRTGLTVAATYKQMSERDRDDGPAIKVRGRQEPPKSDKPRGEPPPVSCAPRKSLSPC